MSALSRSRHLAPIVRRIIGSKAHAGVSTVTLHSFSSVNAVSGRSLLSRRIEGFNVRTAVTSVAKAPDSINGNDEETLEGSGLTPVDHYKETEVALHSINRVVQRCGRVSLPDFNYIVKIIEESGSCSVNHALMLLRCCGSLMVDEDPAERTKLADSVWKTLGDVNVPLDISHYNALLRVYVENEHDFKPAEFLKEVETVKGLKPNRVTFQFLVARYCQLGDISGATVILEHMKDQAMSVNEHVFHSLIVGHCRSGDFESAKETLSMMKESGLNVGCETHAVLLKEMARAGTPGEEIMAALKHAGEELDLLFSDQDLFGLIVALVQAQDEETAQKIVEILPKKSGYYQEMRNHIPAMLRAGRTDIPLQLIKNFKFPINSSASADTQGERGLFMMRFMVKSDYSPEKIMETFHDMCGEENPNMSNRLLEACVDYDKIELGQRLREMIVEKYGNEYTFKGTETGPWMSFRAKTIRNREEAFKFLITQCLIGIRPVASIVCRHLMPVIFKDGPTIIGTLREYLEVKDEVSSGHTMVTPLTPTQYINICIRYKLNEENEKSFKEAAHALANLRVAPLPFLWATSLANVYLATDDKESFKSVMGLSAFHIYGHNAKQEIPKQRDVDTFNVLCHMHTSSPRYRPNQNPDDVVEEVLHELVEMNLGIPLETARLLKNCLKSESALAVVDKLEKLYESGPEYWTEERAKEFMEDQRLVTRMQHRSMPGMSRSRQPSRINKSGYILPENLPKTLEEAEKLQNMLENRGLTNNTISKIVIIKNLQAGNVEEAEKLMKSLQDSSSHYTFLDLDRVVEAFVHQDVNKAREFLERAVIDVADGKCFMATMINIAKHIVKEKSIDEAIDFIGKFKEDNLISQIGMHKEMDPVWDQIAQTTGIEGVESAAEKLLQTDLFQAKTFNKSAIYRPFISALVEKGDMEKAVADFERIAANEKVVPYKSELTVRLIEKEDMERMQRVFDASVEVIGEELSIYDLSKDFLHLGKVAQARKLLATPGLRYNHYKVEQIVKFFRSDPRALELFVQLTEPVFACDREFLYSNLVSVYSKDTNKLREIWVNMQEEGFVPSDTLKMDMAKSFRENGEKPPFVIEAMTSHEPAPSIPRASKSQQSVEQTAYFDYPKFVASLKDGSYTQQSLKDGIKNVRKLNDLEKSLEIIKLLSEEEDFPALFDKKNRTLDIMARLSDDLEMSQLDEMAEVCQNSPELRRKLKVDQKAYKSILNEGEFDKFLDRVRQNGGDYTPSVQILHRVVTEADDLQASITKLQSVADELSSDQLKGRLVMALAIAGKSEEAKDMANKLESEKRSTFAYNLGVDFANASQIKTLVDFLKSMTVPEPLVMNSLYNTLIVEHLKVGNLDDAAAAFKESNIVKAENLKNFILRAIIKGRLPGVSEELKSEAEKVLESRKR